MRVADEVSTAKLRGGFYTPPELVNRVLERVAALLPATGGPLRVLEPSAGDGAFVRGLAASMLAGRISWIDAIERDPVEAARCGDSLAGSGLPGAHHTADLFEWLTRDQAAMHDVVLGNPPYVRYQFIDPQVRAAMAQAVDGPLRGVSNLWIPVVLASLQRLRLGGTFGLVLPAELLTGVSARVLRSWLEDHCETLRIELLRTGEFPGVLQQVALVTGVRGAPGRGLEVEVCERTPGGTSVTWHAQVTAGMVTWTPLLLTRAQQEAFDEASKLPGVRSLGELARFEVAAVTGANDFFTVPHRTVERYRLEPWALPLLGRVRHAPGLTFTLHDLERATEAGERCALLSFDADRPDPHASALDYLASGRARGIHERYKCRSRSPWHRVPSVRAGSLLLSKRSHRFPRLVLNEAEAVTTDTIYRGWIHTSTAFEAADLVASFHNSLTMLSAELEGRSFGGGVLELVPSEIARLRVPEVSLAHRMSELDATLRAVGASGAASMHLVEATDEALLRVLPGLAPGMLHTLAQAHRSLVDRRLGRRGEGPAAL